MIYQRKGKRSAARPEFIQLEQEGTRARMSGSGSDGYVRLKDEHGNTWAAWWSKARETWFIAGFGM
jgi:hypothetical protein